MSKDLDLQSLQPKIKDFMAKLTRHSSFIAVIVILLVYLFTVWKISQLSAAEPTPEDESGAQATTVPHVDQSAINQVLKLENNSPQVHSLFDTARNNPFGQ